MRVVVAAFWLLGCAASVSPVDGSDAATGDVTAGDAVVGDAMACSVARTCTAMAPPEALAAACSAPGGSVELAAAGVSLAFCRCLHGFGPGVDGTLSFSLSNRTARPIQVDLDAQLRLTAVADGRAVELGPCCTQHIARSYTCAGEPSPWRGRVEPARTERLRVDVHVDTPETRPGRYRVALTVQIDGTPREIDMGEAELGLAPTP